VYSTTTITIFWCRMQIVKILLLEDLPLRPPGVFSSVRAD
jgi:hypothetical protein